MILHPLFAGGGLKQVSNSFLGFLVECRIHTVACQDRKSNTSHGLTELLRKFFLSGFTTMKEQTHVARLDLVVIVKLVLPFFFSKVIGLTFVYLFVFFEFLID